MLARDGGMNVPNIGQGLGSVSTFPPTLVGDDTAAPRPDVSPTRLAWFDVNGDGRIDPRSATDGGDATLVVPARAIALSTDGRRVSPPDDAHPAPNKESAADVPPPAPDVPNAAQTNRAVDAYQRYGEASTGADAPATTGR
jgi:hypothetical protein